MLHGKFTYTHPKKMTHIINIFHTWIITDHLGIPGSFPASPTPFPTCFAPPSQVEALFVALDTGRSGSISREDLRLLSLAKRKNDLEMAQQDGNDLDVVFWEGCSCSPW